MIKQIKKNKGFTLIELIVVIAILGILAAILIPQFSGFQERARAKATLADARNILVAVQSIAAEGGTPSDAGDGNVEKLAGMKFPGTFTMSTTDNDSFTYERSATKGGFGDGKTYKVTVTNGEIDTSGDTTDGAQDGCVVTG